MTLLQSVRFTHFLLFDDVLFQPGMGLTIISGESGAGKSLFLEGIQLLFGAKADSALVQGLNQKAVLEAVFEIASRNDVLSFLKENELEGDSELIIRREIATSGKSRCFINDSPVSVQQLKELSFLLLELHSQHETGLVRNNAYQLEILDHLANTSSELLLYKQYFQELNEIKKQLDEALLIQNKSSKEQDYLLFLAQELKEAKLEEISEEELLGEQELLANAAEIVAISNKLNHILDGDEMSLSQMVSELRNGVKTLSNLSSSFSSDLEHFDSAWLELKEVSKEIVKKGEQIVYDPERLAYLELKLQQIQSLKRKHQVDDIASLIEIREQMLAQTQQFSNLDEKIETLQNQLIEKEKQLIEAATSLSNKRENAKKEIEVHMTDLLKSLEMPHASFTISTRFEPIEKWNISGPNGVVFLFSANPGIEPKPMEQVASGGELSRIMLGFKYLSRKNDKLIVFDEIDTGVSGEVARKMGDMLNKMGNTGQILVITHLPQVASKGDTHYLIVKSQTENSANSTMHALSKEQRVFEIGRLLSGKIPGEKALQNAMELLGN